MLAGLIDCDTMKKYANLMNSNSEVQRRRRYKQMEMEENASQKLRETGWGLYSPTIVCDRIGIKEGKTFFIEFKKEGQALTPNQAKVRKLASESYIVVNY